MAQPTKNSLIQPNLFLHLVTKFTCSNQIIFLIDSRPLSKLNNIWLIHPNNIKTSTTCHFKWKFWKSFFPNYLHGTFDVNRVLFRPFYRYFSRKVTMYGITNLVQIFETSNENMLGQVVENLKAGNMGWGGGGGGGVARWIHRGKGFHSFSDINDVSTTERKPSVGRLEDH